MSSIFSIEDIRQIILTFPYTPEETRHGKASVSLDRDQLVSSASGNGFFHSKALLQRFHTMLERSGHGISKFGLGKKLDVTTDAINSLVSHSNGVLLNFDEQIVLSHADRGFLADHLLDDVEDRFVPLLEFCKSYDISTGTIEILTQYINGNRGPETVETSQYDPTSGQYGKQYLNKPRLREELESKTLCQLEEAHASEVVRIWLEDDRSGLDTVSFKLLVEKVLDPAKDRVKGSIALDDGKDEIVFQPEALLLTAKKSLIEGLRTGERPIVLLSEFVELLPSLYPDEGRAEDCLKEELDTSVAFNAGAALSTAWVHSYISKWSEALEFKGYLKASELSQPILNGFEALEDGYKCSTLLRHSATLFMRGRKDGQVALGAYIASIDWLNQLKQEVSDRARRFGQELWLDGVGTSVQDTHLRNPTIVEKALATHELPSDMQSALLNDDKTWEKRAIYEAFELEVRRLENDNQEQFVMMWRDRVKSRSQLYEMGMQSFEAGPLREQLSDLLHEHIIKDLVPEATKRAEAKNLIRSIKTKEQLEKLKVHLHKDQPSSKTVSPALDRFASKLELKTLDPSELATKRGAMLSDMVRGMRKDDDGPRLFLVAVIVLLAKNKEGIVYATGKFAPKLMRMLKPDMGTQQYTRLEQLKDAVKAGSLSKNDQEELRALAEAAVQSIVSPQNGTEH